jgi:hypothetical protein
MICFINVIFLLLSIIFSMFLTFQVLFIIGDIIDGNTLVDVIDDRKRRYKDFLFNRGADNLAEMIINICTKTSQEIEDIKRDKINE